MVLVAQSPTGCDVRSNFVGADSLMMLCCPRLRGLCAGGSSWHGHEGAPRAKNWDDSTTYRLSIRGCTRMEPRVRKQCVHKQRVHKQRPLAAGCCKYFPDRQPQPQAALADSNGPWSLLRENSATSISRTFDLDPRLPGLSVPVKYVGP